MTWIGLLPEPRFDPAPYALARRTDGVGRDMLVGRRGVKVAARRDGTLLAIFTSLAWLDGVLRDQPHITLRRGAHPESSRC